MPPLPARTTRLVRLLLAAMSLASCATVSEAERQAAIDAELRWEEKEARFQPRFSPHFAAAGEVGTSDGGLTLAAWGRLGVRRRHGSFWASGYALQGGAVSVPGPTGRTGWAAQLAAPVRLELTRFESEHNLFPKAAASMFFAPVLAFSPALGAGGGARIGVMGQVVIPGGMGGPIFTEVAFEDLRLDGRRFAGVRVAVGFGL